jgi:hypothetical protein
VACQEIKMISCGGGGEELGIGFGDDGIGAFPD